MAKASNLSLRKSRVRAKVFGTNERPRLSVVISNMHVSAQVIDDEKGRTLAAVTTVGMKEAKDNKNLTEKAALVGAAIGKAAKKIKVKKVVLDRNGRAYAGRLSALADAARKEGLEF